MSWFGFSLAVFFIAGIRKTFYRVGIEKGGDPRTLTAWSMVGQGITATLLLILARDFLNFVNTLLVAIPFGIVYSTYMVLHLKALTKVKSLVVFPLIRLNIIMPILFGILLLKETITLKSLTGMILAMISLFLLWKEKDGQS